MSRTFRTGDRALDTRRNQVAVVTGQILDAGSVLRGEYNGGTWSAHAHTLRLLPPFATVVAGSGPAG
ncbi:hypothetical protein [Streptomyces sp. NBC_01006]|uniref:hypothetical protein n=1 Tax=Streptomyces sp. NBC_01006 TaxID=2903716 RepID=UPI00386714C3|nr:hypothetical protein OG509_00780 [Streptomyces sp. NBC_01006]